MGVWLRYLLGKLKGKHEGEARRCWTGRWCSSAATGRRATGRMHTRNLPILVAGGGFQHGRHVAFAASKNTRLCNLFVTMLQRLGVETDAFGLEHGHGDGPRRAHMRGNEEVRVASKEVDLSPLF